MYYFCTVIQSFDIMNTNKIKEPSLSYPIHPVLFKRWSPRAFSSTPVEPDKLQRIFEAARWAPSASNHQPWQFLVGFKGDPVYSSIFETLVEFNQLWAKQAPVLFLAICKKTNPKGEENKTRQYDTGQAIAHLTFQSMEEGLYIHQMGGFDANKCAELLNLPADYEIITVNALGYQGDPELLHPNLKKMEFTERSRRMLDETVFTGAFGNKASFL